MPISPSNKPVIAITMGDPSGIGPEIVLKSLAKPSVRALANFIVVGNTKALKKTAASLSISSGRILNNVQVMGLNNLPMNSFSFGTIKARYGRASFEYVVEAHGLVRAGIADCIVTAPINKAAVKKAGFKFPGHTEFLASLSGAKRYAMMLSGGPLRVTLVTRHIPINAVSRSLTTGRIADAIDITLRGLEMDFGILSPKIGVCALNPHSGEGGMFGSEEIRLIRPAVSKFKKSGVIGPIAADALFYDAYRKRFDALVCNYHDQGLIPLKMIARDRGVNITLGLDFVRTSPDHGTAFDIAGKGKADSSSMEASIKLAASAVINRKKYLSGKI